MNRLLPESLISDKCLNVSDWVTETHDGRTTCYLCVYYDCFGFGMSLEEVQQAVPKLDALLTHHEASEYGGEIQIDRSGEEDGCVMFAFRPTANHASRYFDFPEDAAHRLLAKLREKLAVADRDWEACISSKGKAA
jgi:hypothetical protein